MEQYIPKSALVAEIERLYDEKGAFYTADVLYNLKEWLDTTEVKEVDLEREINDYFITVDLCEGEEITENTFVKIARHFFELGLRSTITEEDCKLIWNIGDDLPYMSEEEFFKELLRRYKSQKGE